MSLEIFTHKEDKNNSLQSKNKYNKCDKCNKIFKSKQGLIRHFNKKNPCDRILECSRCKKIFSRKGNLIRHLNRKNPCQSKTDKIQFLNKTIELETQKEVFRLKELDKMLEIEKEKTRRKVQQVAKIDNSTNIQQNIQNFINEINISQPTYNVNIFNVNNITDHIEKNILTLGIDKFGNMIEDSDAKQNIIKILGLIYKDTSIPECKNIIYSEMCDKFFTVQDSNQWEETPYEIVKPIIFTSLKKVIAPMMDDYKQNGNFIMDNRSIMIADKNMRLHFKLSDCNTTINMSDKTKKSQKEIQKTIQEGLCTN